VDNIEKEIKAIPLDLRNLRAKKAEVEKEIKGLFNQKIALLEEIAELKNEVLILKTPVDDLKKETEEAKAEFAKVKAEIAAEKSGIEKSRLSLVAQMDQTKAGMVDVDKARHELKRAVELLKVNSLKAREAELELKKGQESLSYDIVDFDKRVVAFDKKEEDSLQKSFEYSFGCRKELERKVEEAKQLNLDLSSKLKVLDVKNQRNDELTRELKTKIQSTEDLSLQYGSMIEKLNRDSADLEKREIEVKIRELRVTKLIKDKEVKKELETLEKSTK
jgi:hypothetical protein